MTDLSILSAIHSRSLRTQEYLLCTFSSNPIPPFRLAQMVPVLALGALSWLFAHLTHHHHGHFRFSSASSRPDTARCSRRTSSSRHHHPRHPSHPRAPVLSTENGVRNYDSGARWWSATPWHVVLEADSGGFW